MFFKTVKNNNKSKSGVYKSYGKKLYGYAITKWNVSEDEAWELIYKTIDKVVDTSNRYTFENEEKFASFIFKIFINYLRNHYRDTKNKQLETVSFNESFEYSEHSEEDAPEVDETESSNMKLLQEELSKLEDWQRTLLLMRAQNYSYEEIANFINKPVGPLKIYYLRYKQRIIKNINDKINYSK